MRFYEYNSIEALLDHGSETVYFGQNLYSNEYNIVVIESKNGPANINCEYRF